MPNILSVSLSAVMNTEPTDSPEARALPLARKGKEPDLKSISCSFKLLSFKPTQATSG